MNLSNYDGSASAARMAEAAAEREKRYERENASDPWLHGESKGLKIRPYPAIEIRIKPDQKD